jgi:hypothetical protein
LHVPYSTVTLRGSYGHRVAAVVTATWCCAENCAEKRGLMQDRSRCNTVLDVRFDTNRPLVMAVYTVYSSDC